MTDAAFSPVTHEEYAYRQIRDAIARGELAAGSRIVQTDWATRLKISATPVREAIRRLQADGLIVVQPHHGATVVGLRREDGFEIYRLRSMIEPLLLPDAISAFTDADATEVRRFCEEMDRTNDPVRFSDLNSAFHTAMTKHCHGWASRIALQLRMASAPYVALTLRAEASRMKESNQDHCDLVEAFVSRDIEAAKEITLRHLHSTLALIARELSALGDGQGS